MPRRGLCQRSRALRKGRTPEATLKGSPTTPDRQLESSLAVAWFVFPLRYFCRKSQAMTRGERKAACGHQGEVRIHPGVRRMQSARLTLSTGYQVGARSYVRAVQLPRLPALFASFKARQACLLLKSMVAIMPSMPSRQPRPTGHSQRILQVTTGEVTEDMGKPKVVSCRIFEST